MLKDLNVAGFGKIRFSKMLLIMASITTFWSVMDTHAAARKPAIDVPQMLGQKLMLDLRYYCEQPVAPGKCRTPMTSLPPDLAKLLIDYQIGGVILFGAFPSAYALLLSSLYLPIMLMLIGLIFRGVAFEYRFKSHTSKVWWNRAFAIGSSLAAFCQGLMLGVLVQGVDADSIASSSLQWLTPFSLFTGLAVMAGYALLGCTYLTMKSRGDIQQKAARYGQRLLLFVMLAMLLLALALVPVAVTSALKINVS